MSLDRVLETAQGLLLSWAWYVIYDHTRRLDNLEKREKRQP